MIGGALIGIGFMIICASFIIWCFEEDLFT
jgi:hypothetical protein